VLLVTPVIFYWLRERELRREERREARGNVDSEERLAWEPAGDDNGRALTEKRRDV
jgi:hypothetical protein